jgi:hypothetical protein
VTAAPLIALCEHSEQQGQQGLRAILKTVGYKGILILEESGKLMLLYEDKILFRSQPKSFAKLLKQVFEGTEKDIEKRLAEMSKRFDDIGNRKKAMEGFVDAGQGKGAKYRPHEIDTLAEAEIIYNSEIKASKQGEAGDAIFQSGLLKGKSIDAIGTPKSAFDGNRWKSRYQDSFDDLIDSIDKHFEKINSPKTNKPLDKILFDFKNYDEFDPSLSLRKHVMEYIEKNYKQYLENGQIDFIN